MSHHLIQDKEDKAKLPIYTVKQQEKNYELLGKKVSERSYNSKGTTNSYKNYISWSTQ
jgi:hypothetical protein